MSNMIAKRENKYRIFISKFLFQVEKRAKNYAQSQFSYLPTALRNKVLISEELVTKCLQATVSVSLENNLGINFRNDNSDKEYVGPHSQYFKPLWALYEILIIELFGSLESFENFYEDQKNEEYAFFAAQFGVEMQKIIYPLACKIGIARNLIEWIHPDLVLFTITFIE
jgi:hypothetical protein